MTILNLNTVLKKDSHILVLMILIVPLTSELKFYPLNETFRISFGAPVFFFLLLLIQKMPATLPGFLTGTAVVGFRILLDFIMQDHFDWISSFQAHFPTFFYYFAYACLFYAAKVKRFQGSSLIIGLIGFGIEILSDFAELMMQYFMLKTTITLSGLSEIIMAAFFHSFIVMSFFNMMKLYEAQSREREVRKQNEHILMIISNLYEESIHLKKTLRDTENITKKSYDLYKRLNCLENEQAEDLRKQALKIAGEVHEVKKDNQRIFAGLSKLISNEGPTDYMEIHELVNIIVRANEKYARLLGKEVQFVYTIDGVHLPYHVYTILSIINNIVVNAVEVIKDTGTITIFIGKEQNSIQFLIEDDGPGVAPKHKDLIFKPGFTSKYDNQGNPSTGIGLSYVKEMVEQLDGDVTFQNRLEGKGAVFTIQLPVKHLIQG
ncbi:sensor histidine kinase [Ectobacillus funiculus]|uniref:histidine kinase n=1 Tax=Ectobacillus funiculus TaxID=137993 RepID=A0ABV5WFM8_9BACI